MKKWLVAFGLIPSLLLAQDGFYNPPSLSMMMTSSFVYTQGANTMAIEDYYSEEAKKSAISLDVSVSDDDIARVATDMAQNYPANERGKYTGMYKQLYQAYAEDKDNPQTFAGAMAAFALGSYMAYHNNYESNQKTNEIFQKLVRQFDAGIKSNPADYEKLSLRDIKDTYLRMSMLDMQLMIATAYARQNHADANIIAGLKDSGRQGLETAFGTSADNIDISTAGLSRK